MAYKLSHRIVSVSLDTYRVPNSRRYVTALRCVTVTGRPVRLVLSPVALDTVLSCLKAHRAALRRRRPLRSVVR